MHLKQTNTLSKEWFLEFLEFLLLLDNLIVRNKDLYNEKFMVCNNKIFVFNNKNYLEYINTFGFEGEYPWVFINNDKFKKDINAIIKLLKMQKKHTKVTVSIGKNDVFFIIKDRVGITSTSSYKIKNLNTFNERDIFIEYEPLVSKIDLPLEHIITGFSGNVIIYLNRKTYEFLYIGVEDDDPLVEGLLSVTLLGEEHHDRNKQCNDFIVFRLNNLELLNIKTTISLYKKGKVFNVKFEYDYQTNKHYKIYKCKPTKDYPKIIHLPTQYQELNNINRFKFTVSNDNPNFLNDLNRLINGLKLITTFSNQKRKQYKFKLDKNTVSKNIEQFKEKNNYDEFQLEYGELYKDEFLSLTISNSKDYTFTFYDLVDYEYFKIIKEWSRTQSKQEINFSLKPLNQNPKLRVLNEILYFLYSKGLYSQTKIKSIGINLCFTDAKQFDQLRLLEFTTSKQKDLYKYFPVEKNKTMYTKPFSFKANIQKPELIITKYLSTIKRGTFYNKQYVELSANEIKEILFSIFRKKFRKANIAVGSESEKRAKYYVLINNVPAKRFDVPINILDEFDITFKSTIDKNTNFIEAYRNRKVKHIDGSSIGCYHFTLNINKWHTDASKISKELNFDDGDFRLNDSLEIIMDNINQFSSKYKLLLVKDNESKEDIENNVTNISKITDFDKMLDEEKDIPDFIKKSEEHISRQLKALLSFSMMKFTS